LSPDVRVLLKTDNPKNNPSLAWVTRYGKSRVFYFQLGHDASAWHNPNYPRILDNGIRWAAGR
jgi:type 1 glutamine amidotransferase